MTKIDKIEQTARSADNVVVDVETVKAAQDTAAMWRRIGAKNSPYKKADTLSFYQRFATRVPKKYIDKAIAALEGRADGHNVATLAAAYAYADAGLHVIDSHGLKHNGKGTGPGGQVKIPRGPGWQHQATRNHEEISKRWRGKGDYPADRKDIVRSAAPINAPRNVSAVFPEGCGLIVIDPDGAEGVAAWEALQREHGPAPKTWASKTGSGGYHYIYRAQGVDIRNTASAIAPGVDVRGKNGQILVSPSLHPNGTAYEWLDGCAPWECEVADAPEWVVKLAYEATKYRSEADAKVEKEVRAKRSAKGSKDRVSGLGFEGYLATIGDGDDLRGFDNPIYSAALSYFATCGDDEAALIETLRDAVMTAPCKDKRNVTRYAQDDYLVNRIAQAREFIDQSREAEPETDLVLEKREHVTEVVTQLGDAPEQEDIDDLIARVSGPLSLVILEEFAKALKKPSGLPIGEVRKMLNHLRPAKNHAGDFPLIAVDNGYRAAREEALAVMVQQDPPNLFHNGGRMVEIAEDEHENLAMKEVGKDVYKARMEAKMDFEIEGAVKEAPSGLVNYVYQQPLPAYPPLHRVTLAPVFGADKTLVTTPGYHPNTGLYYQPKSGVSIVPPSDTPTDDEVDDCVDGLLDLFADFPLDAMTRDELVTAIGKNDDVPSFCHLMSVALTPMCRALIEGPTPLHMLRKDKPRSGATLAASVATKIGTLDYAIPEPFPAKREEVPKTLVATLDKGPGYVFFDNLPDDGKIESGELAAAITAWPEYQGRRLGVNVMVRLKITAAWIGTGNRTALSEELAERALLTEIDPQMEKPGTRDKALYKYDLSSHVPTNAGHYYHCLLTLVQNWIAKGCPEYKGDCLGGFERHAAVIGGILEAAGIHGFMGNAAKMRATVASANPEHALLDAMIEAHNAKPTVFRVSGTDAPPKEIGPKDDRKLFEHADKRVLSIMGLLNAGHINLKNWGYALENGEIFYPDSANKIVAQKFALMTGTVREWGDAETEELHLQKRYVLKKAHTDKHGGIYTFKVLDRV